MTITWDDAGTHTYETGVDHGILFNRADPAVPWNGLVQVSLDVSGGEASPSWYDGVKYKDRMLAESFQATVSVVSVPKEFARCEGLVSPKAGMYRPFGKRDKFDLVWRTQIGNDINQDLGYKLHIAYNCIVQPSARNYQTLSDQSFSPDVRSFVMTATPTICGPWSYFWFDSRECDLSALEAELMAGNLPSCASLPGLIGAPGGGGGEPTDPDENCAHLLETFDDYIHGQVVSADVTDGIYETKISGLINNGLDIIELPANGTFTANDSAATETGTHPVLTDDDDATYISSADGDLGYTIGLPPLVGYVEGAALELHIRMSISGDVSEDDPDNLDADAQVHISTDAGGDDIVGGFTDGTDDGVGFALEAVDGTIVDYVVPLNMDAWIDTTLADVVAALEAGAYLNVVGASNNNPDTTPEVRVYEASVVMLNDTDADKWLRTDSPTDQGYVEIQVFEDDSRVDDQGVANTVTFDFKVLQVPYNADVSGYTEQIFNTSGATGVYNPGTLYVQLDGDENPILRWFDHSAADAADYVLTPNLWYTAKIDSMYDHVTISVVVRGTTDVVLTHEDTFDQTPNAYSNNGVGMVGGDDNTFEVVVDNAKIQTHCNEEAPPGPPSGDYELAILPTSTTSEGSTSSHSPFIVGSGNVLADDDDGSYGWVDWVRTVKGVYPLWNTVDPHTHTDLPTHLPAIYPECDALSAGDIDPAWVNTIAFRFRAMALEADAIIGLQLFAQTSKLLTNPSYGPHSPLAFNMGANVWHNFEWGFTPDEYDTGGWAPSGIQSALNDMFPGYLYCRTVPLNPTDNSLLADYNIKIAEQYMVLYYTIP